MQPKKRTEHRTLFCLSQADCQHDYAFRYFHSMSCAAGKKAHEIDYAFVPANRSIQPEVCAFIPSKMHHALFCLMLHTLKKFCTCSTLTLVHIFSAPSVIRIKEQCQNTHLFTLKRMIPKTDFRPKSSYACLPPGGSTDICKYHFLCFLTIIQVKVISGHQVKKVKQKKFVI